MRRPAPGILPRPVAPATGSGVVVHYHEIGLKGRNRGYFERRLVDNLRDALRDCETSGIDVLNGRFVVRTPAPATSDVLDRVAHTFGVATFASCVVTSAEVEAMLSAAMTQLTGRRFATFAVAARRATKDVPFTSREINVRLGAAIQARTSAGVHLDDPDVRVWVEVVGKHAIVYIDKASGPGGLPVGVSGKVVSLLSGGIDSPVATHRIAKRGAKAVLCHFHSAPFTDTSSARKARELSSILASWQGDTTLYVVAIGEAQQQIVRVAPPDLRVVLYRRLMVRIGAEIARREGAGALVTGDSLGQVASQTLQNMVCVDDASPMTVLRPLVGFDKQEIVSEAKRIGTYETSIQPFQDCCALFVPRSPATRADVGACRAAESELDLDAMVEGCVRGAEMLRVERPRRTEAA